MRKILNAIAVPLSALGVSLMLVALGFLICITPPVTGVFARAFSGCENPDTPFAKEQLVLAAQGIRAYSFTSHSQEELLEMLHQINAAAQTPYADASDEELLAAPEEYSLDASALSHLDDVHAVAKRAYLFIGFVFALALASLAHVAFHLKRRWVGRAIFVGALLVLLIFLGLGAWVALDFNGFFAIFHTLFFADGTWTFSYRSLMITALPTPFWAGAGALWVICTLLVSVACLLVGKRLMGGKRAQKIQGGSK